MPGVQPLPAPGETFAGKYTIVRTVGEGGMGVVFEAIHLKLQQRVAIKVLRSEAQRTTDVMARFEREARAAGRLRSKHVARVIDVDSTPDGTPFMVMELLTGHDIADEMDERLIPVGEAVDWVLQACVAMTEAHAIGIVHRDLKPSNLFLAEQDGRRIVKVLDFGISKVRREQELDVTTTQSTLGTPLYMSPEQVRSAKKVDGRSDIWSLGVILYELLAERPPFDEENATAVVAAIAADAPTPLHERRRDLPRELTDAVMKTLEKDPAKRFQTVEELADALEPFRGCTRVGSFSDSPPRRTYPSLPREFSKELQETLPAGSPANDPLARLSRPDPDAEARETPAPVEPPRPATPVPDAASTTALKSIATTPPPAPRRAPRWGLIAGLGVLAAGIAVASIVAARGGASSAPGSELPGSAAPLQAGASPERAPVAGPISPEPAVTPAQGEPPAETSAEPRRPAGAKPRARTPDHAPAASAKPAVPAPPPPDPTPLHL